MQKVRKARPEDDEEQPAPSEKLYFEANSINEMPQGSFGREITKKEERYVLQAKDRDPDWPMLLPPDGPNWQAFKDEYDLASLAQTRGKNYFQNGEGHFGEAPANTGAPADPDTGSKGLQQPPPESEQGKKLEPARETMPEPRHTADKYRKMTVVQMHVELEDHRNMDKNKLRAKRKEALVEKLMLEDRRGNFGQGVWKGETTRPKRKEGPVATDMTVNEDRKTRSKKR